MDVKIGVQYAARELIIESSESVEDVEKAVTDAVSGSAEVLTLTDSKGRRIIVPSDKIAYVEIGGGAAGAVGFRS